MLDNRHSNPKMVSLVPPSRSTILLLALLDMTLLCCGFPLRHYPTIGQEDSKMVPWEVLYPSISLLDWSIQTMSAPEVTEPKPEPGLLVGKAWLPMGQSEMEELDKSWSSDWSPWAGQKDKRNIVVADDAAFREKSKLLTAMERQKWLNSYMQKLLVVNSQ